MLGDFCWAELMTTAAPEAKAFYGAVFGWAAAPGILADDPAYATMRLADADVCGLFQMSDSLKAQRVPPHWTVHVRVADARRAADRAAELGGGVVSEPFAVGDGGRMAMLQDPTGAMINVWEPGEHAGIVRSAAPGRLAWLELATSDLDAAVRFYSELFGWRTLREDAGAMRYTTLATAEGREVAAMLQLPPEWRGIPSHWLPYFSVASCERAADAAARAGGMVMTPSTEGGHGAFTRFAVLRDPQAAAFGVVAR